MFEIVLLAEMFRSIVDQYEHDKTQDQIDDIVKICIGTSMAHIQNQISPMELILSKER